VALSGYKNLSFLIKTWHRRKKERSLREGRKEIYGAEGGRGQLREKDVVPRGTAQTNSGVAYRGHRLPAKKGKKGPKALDEGTDGQAILQLRRERDLPDGERKGGNERRRIGVSVCFSIIGKSSITIQGGEGRGVFFLSALGVGKGLSFLILKKD